ncbi:TonB-dependent receptor [Pseudomaricurvus alkylphenolicus]|uniref:TonB-dependent receptor domain-containing protein n=1 Tax=Pseudomaricurvus alkylphenolicus TaxID=1306991 RepID=UPI0014206E04|nr:TonB-dependent receptor [Pseudomaricurvus alkylphenolicus]NIB40561.1 TonB-dependent receptor [Pseudomaricurvus alkylphenolicus]
MRRHISRKTTESGKCRRLLGFCCRILLLLLLAGYVSAEVIAKRVYQIQVPARNVAEALTILSKQTDVQVLFPYDLAVTRSANEVSGRLTLHEALERLLHGTDLTGGLSDKGVLMVTLREPGTDNDEGKDKMIESGTAKKSILATFIGFLVGSGGSQYAFAQTDDFTLEEIVVTAQKREQSINDVGITVNAFTPEDLKNFGVKSAEDLEQMTPGLTVTNSQPAGAPVYTIRGVGFNDFTAAASSTVGLYADGASIPYPVMTRSALFDLERVEVLKGPQGDLYGRNTTAGQINFISRKPTDETEAGVTLDYSRYETVDVEAYVSGALSEAVNARVAIKSITSGEGWQESITRPGDELGERDELAVRALFDIDINDDASLLLKFHHFANKSDNIAGTPTTVGGAPVPVSNDHEDADWTENHRPENDNTLQGVSAKLEWDLGGVGLTSITAYDKYDREATYDTSGVPAIDADVFNDTEIEVFSQELRLESNGGDDLYWTAGVFYSQDEVDEVYNLNFIETVGLHLENRYTQESESMAVFGHVEYQLTEQFRLSLGARYTEEERDISVCTYDVGDGSIAGFYNFFVSPFFFEPAGFSPSVLEPGDCALFNDVVGTPGAGDFTPLDDTIDTEDLMGKITLDYAPNDDLLFYGTVSTGFKSGGFNGAGALVHTQVLPYEKEELMSFELGMKSTLLDGRMQLNAALFLYDYEDKQELDNFIAPIGDVVGITNVPESKVQGAEVEMRWAVTQGLVVNLGLAYLDSEIEEFTTSCPAGLFGGAVTLPAACPERSSFDNVIPFDASGSKLDNAPEWQATASVTYSWPVTESLMMMLGGDVSYKDDNLGSRAAENSDSLFYLPDYTIVNLRAGISDAEGKWSATLWGRNMTDEYYWGSTSTSNTTTIRLNGMPKTYGVTLSYNY